MARYIDADELRFVILNHANREHCKGNHDKEKTFTHCLYLIDCMPITDVVEVVHGEWIKMDKRGNNVQCSKCRNTLDLRGVNAGRGDANYCPNCGAKMSTQSNAFLTH